MNKVEAFIKETEEFGFRKILEIPFKVAIEKDHIQDTFYVFFHENYGILLEFDTYWNGSDVNSGHAYYEWVPADNAITQQYVETGGYEKVGDLSIWMGYHDCREGLIKNLKNLAAHGVFRTPWETPLNIFHPKFVHWGDSHTNLYAPWDEGYRMYQKACKKQGRERYNMLPENMRKAIGIAYKKGHKAEPSAIDQLIEKENHGMEENNHVL